MLIHLTQDANSSHFSSAIFSLIRQVIAHSCWHKKASPFYDFSNKTRSNQLTV